MGRRRGLEEGMGDFWRKSEYELFKARTKLETLLMLPYSYCLRTTYPGLVFDQGEPSNLIEDEGRPCIDDNPAFRTFTPLL